MTRRLIQSFRGLRAALLLDSAADHRLLADALIRLGLEVTTADPADHSSAWESLAGADMIFFDADIIDSLPVPWSDAPSVPMVAIIGLEAPTRLNRAFEIGPAALLYKPLRSSGIYPALFFAANEHRRRAELTERLKSLEERHGARRFVQKAILDVMERHDCDDEEAFRLLRRESMRQRITVEELAMRVVAAGPPRLVRNV
jgi:two-component system, response regulator / RNA-binding antiterminator